MQELHGLVSSDRRVPASVALVTRREGQLLEAEATVPSSGVGAGRLSPGLECPHGSHVANVILRVCRQIRLLPPLSLSSSYYLGIPLVD